MMIPITTPTLRPFPSLLGFVLDEPRLGQRSATRQKTHSISMLLGVPMLTTAWRRLQAWSEKGRDWRSAISYCHKHYLTVSIMAEHFLLTFAWCLSQRSVALGRVSNDSFMTIRSASQRSGYGGAFAFNLATNLQQ
jgi:hypothetical protein